MSKGFLRGFGSVIDLFPSTSRDIDLSLPNRSDTEALKSDWEKIGGDMRHILEENDPSK